LIGNGQIKTFKTRFQALGFSNHRRQLAQLVGLGGLVSRASLFY